MQEPPIICCFEEIEEGNKLLDFDDRYEMSRTGNNLNYWLHGVDIQQFPECMWGLVHEKCTRDGCLLRRKDRGTIFRLSRLNKDTIRLQKISKGQALGKEPIDFEYNEPKNKEEAARRSRKAADQGNADAQHNLGVRYANGEGEEKDWREAVR